MLEVAGGEMEGLLFGRGYVSFSTSFSGSALFCPVPSSVMLWLDLSRLTY